MVEKLENGQWERTTNKELEVLYGKNYVIGYVKAQRLRWLDHLKRIPQSRIPKMILTSTIGKKRRKGKPKERWSTEVIKNIQNLGITNWEDKQ